MLNLLDPNLSGKVHFDGEPDLTKRMARLFEPTPAPPVSRWKNLFVTLRSYVSHKTRLAATETTKTA